MGFVNRLDHMNPNDSGHRGPFGHPETSPETSAGTPKVVAKVTLLLVSRRASLGAPLVTPLKFSRRPLTWWKTHGGVTVAQRKSQSSGEEFLSWLK